jgi:hypothetical protein
MSGQVGMTKTNLKPHLTRKGFKLDEFAFCPFNPESETF